MCDYRDAAVKLLRDTIGQYLAGEINYAEISTSRIQLRPWSATTDVATPANTNVSSGFEAILIHATANNNPDAGDERNSDTGLVYGDLYLVEAGDRLLKHVEDHGRWVL